MKYKNSTLDRLTRISISLLLLIALALEFVPASADTIKAKTGFYRVEGQQILDPAGDPVILKGMNFSNGLYSTPDSVDDYVVTIDHTAESYQELAKMGLDHVRFEFNYQLFESDDKPYTYKEDGFELIDQNLEWAKAAGIDLILQLKWTQGGYQMETDVMKPSETGIGNGGKGLWMDIDADENCQALR